MQGNNADSPEASFRKFLADHRSAIFIILLACLIVRVTLALQYPRTAGDEIRYTTPAINMLAGHGFTLDTREPYRPSAHAMPLYPLFIASVYS